MRFRFRLKYPAQPAVPHLGGRHAEFIVLGGILQLQGDILAVVRAALRRRIRDRQRRPLSHGGENGLEPPAIVLIGIGIAVQIPVKAEKILLAVQRFYVRQFFGKMLKRIVGEKKADARVGQQAPSSQEASRSVSGRVGDVRSRLSYRPSRAVSRGQAPSSSSLGISWSVLSP